MTDMVAGEVLGPRPGKAACSFSQGVVEMILRIGAIIFGILPVIAGALTIGFNENYEPATTNEVGNISDTLMQTRASGSLDVISGLLVVIWAVVMIVLRILNIGALNLGAKYFLAVDIIINSILAIVMLAVGIISAVFSDPWDDLNGNDADAVYASMIAGAIVCIICGVYLAVLVIFMIIYLIKDWNKEIIKYTIKDAVMG